ncbi:MAG: hypothetical protein JNJ45_02870 [Chthonomonas sp.]|nr:hypothetical protein [Chthonomonas sp.]
MATHKDSVIPTLLHEIGHVVDREVVGRGKLLSSRSQLFSPPAKIIKLICREIRTSNEFQLWQGHLREVALFVDAWADPSIQDELTEADRREASRLKRKLKVAERYCSIPEWFANEYARHVIEQAFALDIISTADRTRFMNSFEYEEDKIWEHHFRGSHAQSRASVLVRSTNGETRLTRYFSSLFKNMELA